MDLATVMQAINDRLDTIAGLRCHASPPGSVTPPAAIVSYPDKYDYDETYGRGFDRISALPVVVVVGRPTDRPTRDSIAAYVAPTGPSSVKAVLESGAYSAFDELRVTGVEFDVVGIGGVDYLAAIFTLDIVGSGR